MESEIEILEWLQLWFYKNCNGDWEHGNIISIRTLDNPGWSVTINLESTELEDKFFRKVDIERTEDNWVCCFIKNNKFEGRCGPLNLLEVLQVFNKWAIA